MSGKVILVGAGPGDIGLITVRGFEAIAEADVVVYDNLINKALLEHARSTAEMINAGKSSERHVMEQDEINAVLVEKASAGKIVCRLKGGDPFLFGRGGEEALSLNQAGIEFEIVPGVSALASVPAYAGIPITQRGINSTFGVITGHEDPTKPSSDVDWSKIATGLGTLIFFMGVRNLPMIAEALVANGRSPETPVALVRHGTLPQQQTLVGTLADIAEKAKHSGFRPPAIIVVGDVVKLRESLTWFENKPLFGRTVVVTRTRTQASKLAKELGRLGARVIEFPTIEIKPPRDPEPLTSALARLQEFDWVVFTSPNGVRSVRDLLESLGMDARAFCGTKICAIGPATAEVLEEIGLKADLLPRRFIAEGVFEVLSELNEIDGQRFLVPHSAMAREYLAGALTDAGGEVTEVAAYETVLDESSRKRVGEILEADVDVVTFTSSSTATNFVSLVGPDEAKAFGRRAAFASMGPITSDTIRSLGFDVAIEAETQTLGALVDAIVSHCTKKDQGE